MIERIIVINYCMINLLIFFLLILPLAFFSKIIFRLQKKVKMRKKIEKIIFRHKLIFYFLKFSNSKTFHTRPVIIFGN